MYDYTYLNISNNQLIDPILNDQLLTKNVNSNNHFNILVYDIEKRTKSYNPPDGYKKINENGIVIDMV